MPNSEQGFTITNTTKGTPPRGVPFVQIKNTALGTGFSVSLVFVTNNMSRELNRKYRGKNTPANVLSFLIDKRIGEIFINLLRAKQEALKYGKTPRKYVGFLFIHALLHLKGLSHGSTMERLEKRLTRRFGF